jgi:L-threonate 2-dehydrogenase
MPQVGFIGLGVLGSAIAANMVSGGLDVLGYDVSESARKASAEQGVTEAASLDEVARACAVIFTCLPNAKALMDVISGDAGIASVAFDGQIIVELSTLALEDKNAGREALEAVGRKVLDCPVSGNRIMALNKGLTAFCSGEHADYLAVHDAIMTFAKKVHFVGAFGNGSKTKFCGNILNLVHNTVAAEAMVLAIKSGLDPKVFHEVISGSGSSSAMFEVRGALMADNDYGKEGMNFSIPLKDAPIIAQHAASVGAPISLYQVAVQYYHAANAQGLGHLDAAAVCRVMERMANCEREPSQ